MNLKKIILPLATALLLYARMFMLPLTRAAAVTDSSVK